MKVMMVSQEVEAESREVKDDWNQRVSSVT